MPSAADYDRRELDAAAEEVNMTLKDLLTVTKLVSVFNSYDGDRSALAGFSDAIWVQACL
jgi:hypothetical protein